MSGRLPVAPTVALFDPSGTSHSGNAFRGLVGAAVNLGVDVTVYAHPSIPHANEQTGLRWVEMEGPREANEPARRREHRRVLLEALDDFEPGPNRVFCDLGLDRTLESRGAPIAASPNTVFVCHRAGALDRKPVRWRGKVQRIRSRNRAVVRALGRDRARFVAHTDAVATRLAEFVPADQVVKVGWPVVTGHEPNLAPDWQPHVTDRMVLFAGSMRLEKGVEQFLRATRDLPGYDRIVVTGRVPKLLHHAVSDADPRVEFWDRWLTEQEYEEAFESAALVVLPYVSQYGERGTMSSVLLEALAYGRPVLLSEPIAHLLPPDYAGAVVTAARSDTELADGLRCALGELGNLERAAMRDGRRFVATHHTYDGYLRGLLRAGGAPPS